MANKTPTERPEQAGFRRLFSKALQGDWSRVARPNQLPPPGDWRAWLLLAGRGFGKTRTVCEFVRGEVEAGRACRVALVAATAADARDVLVTGHSGILAISPEWNRPTYEPTKRLLTWSNGAIATVYSADEPDRLRGPQFDLAICDELAAWRYPEALDMLLLGLRIGKNPRVAIATTPRPTKVIRDLLAREGKDVVVTRGSTLENRENLAPAYVEQIIDRYKGTRLERQEIFGEVLEDTPGALWNRENLEQTRVEETPKDLQRIVVAIDPAGSSEEGADETGIIVAGLGQDGHGYVLEDLSGRYDPPGWARRAIGAYHVWKADRIVCETNFGGEMVANTIAAIDSSIPVKTISSSRGKVLRAEPVATFFEQRKAHMVGSHPELEDQACRFTTDWVRSRDGSPDRVDAKVFALTELMLGAPPGGFIKPDALLPRDSSGMLPPIDEPALMSGLFVSIAAGVGLVPDTMGIVVFGFMTFSSPTPPLVVLDWDLLEIETDTMARLGRALRLHLGDFAERIRLLNGAGADSPIVFDPAAVGTVAYELIGESGANVNLIEDEKLLTMSAPQRVISASGYITAGHVKIARAAHEQTTECKRERRNHLLHEIAAFGVAEQAAQTPPGALLTAFANGVLLGATDPQIHRLLSSETAT